MKKTIKDDQPRRKLSLKTLTVRTLSEKISGGTNEIGDGGFETGYCTCRCTAADGCNCYPGRPLVVEGAVRVADVEEREDWE